MIQSNGSGKASLTRWYLSRGLNQVSEHLGKNLQAEDTASAKALRVERPRDSKKARIAWASSARRGTGSRR